MRAGPRMALLLACMVVRLIPVDNAHAAPPRTSYKGVSGLNSVTSDVPEGEALSMSAPEILTWERSDAASANGMTAVVQLGRSGSGFGISLQLDRTHLTAQSAVVWITRVAGSAVDAQQVRIALLGDARVEQDGVVRSGPNLYVTATIRGEIRMETPQRVARDVSAEETYRLADNLRQVAEVPTERLGAAVFARPAGEPQQAREIGSVELRKDPVRFRADEMVSVPTSDGTSALLCTGHFTLYWRDAKGDFLELRADRAVMLTNLKSLTDPQALSNDGSNSDKIDGVYLEGDVRITFSPGKRSAIGEQRLEASRAFYELASDRAVLTDAVIHTIEAQKQLPLVLRAKTVQQLSKGEYDAQRVEVSTSSFAVPTYSVRASTVFVRRTGEGDDARTHFQAKNLTLNALHVPFFYFPYAAGDAENFPLRSLSFESGDRFGFGVRTTFGLYELLGMPHPKGLDAAVRADYLANRGPATGLDLDYHGGLITETTAEPWNFEGKLRSYIIDDHGYDSFAGARSDVHFDNQVRGQFLFEHQHFLPDDWQVQIRAGYASDETFLEEYFQREFDSQLPYELAFYAKRQRDSEQLSFLATIAPNEFPTTADNVQEQVQVERYPEVGYRRIGESVLDDRFTFFSDNLASLLSFRNSGEFGPGGAAGGIPDQGYRTGLSPGIRDFDQTGVDANGNSTESTIARADFRQQLDYPLQAGRFKVVPYVLGRYTAYSDSPSGYAAGPNSGSVNPTRLVDAKGGAENRIYAATGARLATAFWRVDDTAESELFDIHRVRHVIEPVANVYVSGSTVDATDLYIYDQPIDEANDIQAAQFRLEQRWQTQRGGPGRWRSVDFLALNVEANAFVNKPDETTFLTPSGFRGLYFDGLPEASVPRDSLNADATWRVSDTMIVLADEEYNLDESRLATAAAGFSIQRDTRLSYFAEQRYIEPLDSNITTVGLTYEISAKYSVQLQQSYDFSQANNVSSSASILRKFDRLIGVFTVYQDSVNDDTGFRFAILPEGLNSRSSSRFFNALSPQDRKTR